jgi:NAD(P)-dependent dehydrogenase (short-subunit alcohol dehydrogenase family)
MPTTLITGSTDGIGLATARVLVQAGHDVIIHGRNQARVDAAVADVGAHGGVCFDLASLDAIRAGAADLVTRFGPIHILINNAATFSHQRRETVDGYELTFAVNHLAPFLLTELLLPSLLASAPARVINLSSVAHHHGRVNIADLQSTRGYSGQPVYAMSKLCNILHSNALAARHPAHAVTANSLHPGVIDTKLLKVGFNIPGASVESGTRTSVRLATDPALAEVTGRYFSDEREARTIAVAGDRELQQQLWDASARLTGTA